MRESVVDDSHTEPEDGAQPRPEPLAYLAAEYPSTVVSLHITAYATGVCQLMPLCGLS